MLVISSLCLFLGLQVIALGDFVRSGFAQGWKMLWDFERYLGYPEFLCLVLFVALLSDVSFLYNVPFSRNGRTMMLGRILTGEERGRVSHLSGIREAKKGTVRIEFDREGRMRGDDTLKGRMDLLSDGFKRGWNRIVELLKLPDVRKLNTLHEWRIEGRTVRRRVGKSY